MYAAAPTKGKAYYYPSGDIYTNTVMCNGLEANTFEELHNNFAKKHGKGEKLRSLAGPKLGENTKPIDYAILYYDASDPVFLQDTKHVEEVLKCKNPNIVIDQVALTKDGPKDAFGSAFDRLSAFCTDEKHPDKERVLCYYSGHGKLGKPINGNPQFEQLDGCFNEQRMLRNMRKVEGELEAGWFIGATCHFGAATQ